MRFWVYLAVGILSLLVVAFAWETLPALAGICGGILAGICLLFIDKLAFETRYLWLALLGAARYRRRQIRLSISYLFRIRVDDKYLLVRGSRIPSQYQPVGGVFKRLPESYNILSRLDVRDDDKIPIDNVSKRDLRIRVAGKNVVKVLKWYDSGSGRELDPWREFYEELVRPSILAQAQFPHISYRHVRRHQTPLHWTRHLQCYQILIAEIYELIPTETQEQALRDLMTIESTDYLWVRESLILTGGVEPGRPSPKYTISDHSTWIL